MCKTYMMILAAMLPSVSTWVVFSRAWRRPTVAAAESLDRLSRSAKRASHFYSCSGKRFVEDFRICVHGAAPSSKGGGGLVARSRPATPHKCQTDPIVEGDYGIPHQIATHGLARGDQPTESGGRSMALAWMEQPRIVVFGTTRERSRGVEDDSRGRKEHESRRLFVARKKIVSLFTSMTLKEPAATERPFTYCRWGFIPQKETQLLVVTC